MILEGIEGSSVNEPVAVSRKQEQAKWLNDGGGNLLEIPGYCL